MHAWIPHANLGATHVINTRQVDNLGEAIRAIAPRGVDAIVDAAGVNALIGAAIGGLAILGHVALVAVPSVAGKQLELPWLTFLLAGQSVQGYIEGNAISEVFIPQLIELYQQGRFPFDRLISFYPFRRDRAGSGRPALRQDHQGGAGNGRLSQCATT